MEPTLSGNNEIGRRRFFRSFGIASLSAFMLWNANSCRLFEDSEMFVCTLDELKEKGSLLSRFNGKQILVVSLDDEIVIFSLICSHKKCTVAFEEASDIFKCPCHEGTYDKYGEVIGGPPPRPLSRFQYETRGEGLWVLNTFTSA